MISTNVLLIASAEFALLLLVVCVVLVIQNRSLRKMVNQLKEKARDVISELKATKRTLAEADKAEPETAESLSYVDYVERALNETVEHHGSLNSNQPIALDIEPGTPLPHRTAALRHAIMLAEKDAFGRSEVNNENFDEIHTELQNAKKRISNLEKFKQLYFDLEEQWKNSQENAQHAFNNLTTLASGLDESGKLGHALDEYQSSYDGLSTLFHKASGNDSLVLGSTESSGASEEVKQLRNVAADQHRIIQGLQKQLMNANTDSERESVVNGLQTELQKQARFIQESETCIQLLEDELSTTCHELEQLRTKSNQVPELKTELVNLRKQSDELELKYHTTLSENRKLQKQMKEHSSGASPKGSNDDSVKLKKELSDLVERYSDLEERFLDLKMQQ